MFRSLGFQSFITNVAVLGLGMAGSVLLARWLLPTGRGEIAAAMLWPVLLTYLGSLGLIDAIVYFSAMPEAQLDAIYGTSLALAIAQSAIIVPIGFAVMPWVLASQEPGVVQASRLYLMLVPLSLMTQYGSSILQGRVLLVAVNWLRLIVPVGYLLGTVLLHFIGELTIVSIIVLHLALNAFGLLGTLLLLRQAGIGSHVRVSPILAQQMLTYGLKVQVGVVMQGANLRLDQLLMAAWVTPAQLGLYVVAVSASSLTQPLTIAVRTVIMPSIVRLEDPNMRLAYLRISFQRYWLLSLLYILPLGATFFWALPFVFGADFRSAIWPAEVLLLGSLCMGAKEVLATGARALGNPWLGSKAEIIAFVVTVVLLVLLLPKLGIMGAAIASLGAYSTSLCMIVYGIQKTNALAPHELFRINLKTVQGLVVDFQRRFAR
jgi:O-antigen/teichoic acid export membrane protein